PVPSVSLPYLLSAIVCKCDIFYAKPVKPEMRLITRRGSHDKKNLLFALVARDLGLPIRVCGVRRGNEDRGSAPG
ncbi:MAG: hypothetical protein AAB281_06050, partial [Actinomycetota bacterium]